MRLNCIVKFPFVGGLPADARNAQTLDEVLNIEEGKLTFFNGDSDNALDRSIDIDAAKSSNRDSDNSKSNVSTTVFAQAGQVLEFSYRVMSQQDCVFLFFSNGQEIVRWFGIMDYYAPLEKFTFPAGEEAGGCFVYDMAYDYERQRMFAMATHYCSDFWLIEADRRDGSVTTIAEMNALGKNAWGFTIDSEGNAYTTPASDTGSYDRTDTGRSASVNLETGRCTIIADTGIPTCFANTMKFDHCSQCIYRCNSLSNRLYILDHHTGETEFCGGLYNGGDYMAIFLPNDLEVSDPDQPTEPTPVPPTDTPEPTPVPGTGTSVRENFFADVPEPTPVPGTGTVGLIGLSIAVITAGTGIITLRKKDE